MSGGPATGFDKDALEAYLRQHLPDLSGPLELTPTSGGQSNPTFFLTIGPKRLVLRKQPPGELLRGAHAIDREYRVLSALAGTDVPVPQTVHFCNDPAVIGTPFYLMERLDGRIFDDCALADLPAGERRGIYLGMADALAALHAIVPEDIGLADYGRPGNYFERQFHRWNGQFEKSDGPPIPGLTQVATWLERHMPSGDDAPVCICHGDFRLGNLMFHPSEPRVIGILDWELSTLGHPLADLGFCVMPWQTAPDEYGGILGLDLKALQLPAEADFVARYERRFDKAGPLQPVHKAFALFRFAVIFVGIADRVRAGNAADPQAARFGPLAERFAHRALQVIGDA